MKFVTFAVAAAAVSTIALPANAATVIYGPTNPAGVVTLEPAGPGAQAQSFSFDVQGNGSFTAVLSFTNPYPQAVAGGSATFNFDPDVIQFTEGYFSDGSTFALTTTPTGAAINIQDIELGFGQQTLTIIGNLIPATNGNSYARIGGQLTLTSTAVPEPATWVALILGFGVIGGTLRRRTGAGSAVRASLRYS